MLYYESELRFRSLECSPSLVSFLVCFPNILCQSIIFLDFGKKIDDLPITTGGKIDHSQKKLEDKCCIITFLIFLLLFIIFFIYSVATQNVSQWTEQHDIKFAIPVDLLSLFF